MSYDAENPRVGDVKSWPAMISYDDGATLVPLGYRDSAKVTEVSDTEVTVQSEDGAVQTWSRDAWRGPWPGAEWVGG